MNKIAKIIFYIFAIAVSAGMIIFIAIGPTDTGKNQLNGKFSFSTNTEAACNITGRIEGSENEVELSNLTYTETQAPTISSLSTWSNSLFFDGERSDIVATITIENTNFSYPLSVSLNDKVGELTNIVKHMTVNGEDYESSKRIVLQQATETSTDKLTFRVVFSVENSEIDVVGAKYNFVIRLVGGNIIDINEDDPTQPVNPIHDDSNDFADSYTTGLTFSYDDTSYEATVTGVSSSGSGKTEFRIPANIVNNKNFYKVTAIAASAFAYNSKITSVTLPNMVKSIGYRAFYSCSNLRNIYISKTVSSVGGEAFFGCTSLSNITIMSDNVYIADYAFNNAAYSPKVYIESIKTWCKYSFASASANPLYSRSGSSNGALYLYGSSYPISEVVIPDSFSQIKQYAFRNCGSINTITIPSTITQIGSYAFEYCNGITKVNISDVDAWSKIDFATPYSNPAHSNGKLWKDGQQLSTVVLTNVVTSISKYAFYNCRGITNILIPSSVTSIGMEAFYSCYDITAVQTPSLQSWCAISFANANANPLFYGKKLYNDGTLVVNLTIPNTITQIKDYTFYNLTSLEVLSLNNVTSIGVSAFNGCTGLNMVNVPTTLTTIGNEAFANCKNSYGVYISDITAWCNIAFASATSNPLFCGHNLFLNNIQQTSIELPGISTIKKYSFAGCGASSIIFPDTITKIEEGAFNNCKNITILDLKNNLTTIEANAFSGDSALTTVNIPSSVTQIKNGAFSDCSSLNRVNITDINKWVAISFENGTANPLNCAHNLYLNNAQITDIPALTATQIKQYVFYGLGLTSITIPDGITSIGKYCFASNNNLRDVHIPTSLITFGVGAFKDDTNIQNVYISDMSAWCSSAFGYETDNIYSNISTQPHSNPLFYGGSLYLNNTKVQDLTIPAGITQIKDFVFVGCSSLQSVVIPSSLTSINRGAFSGCSSLQTVSVSDSLTSIARDAFNYCTHITKVNITSLATWFAINFENAYSNPLAYGSGLYLSNTVLSTITIPSGVSTIKKYAFYGSKAITTVFIGSSVTSISDNAFYGCSNLNNVYIDSSSVLQAISSQSSCGYLISYISKASGGLYISNRITAFRSSYISTNYIVTDTTETINNVEYTKWTKK